MLKQHVNDKTPSHTVHFESLNDDDQVPRNSAPFNRDPTALYQDNRGQSESLGNINSSPQEQSQRVSKDSLANESQTGDIDDTTTGSGLLDSSKNSEETPGGDANKGILKNKRIRQLSAPSSAFRSVDFDSQKSLDKMPHEGRRMRQDSISSAGFGSSHFGSSAKRKGSVCSAHRVNIVTDAASIEPTPSIDHIPHLNELYPYNYDPTYQDGLELRDIEINGDAKLPTDSEVAAGDAALDEDGKSKWLTKLPDIRENPEADGLSKPGNGTPFDGAGFGSDMEKMTFEEEEEFKRKERRKYMKNLLVLCTGFFFVFTAFLSLRNLQSSLNAKDGLGLYALSATYACFFIGCIMATTIVQRLGPKRAIVISTIGPFLYVIANFHPLFFTLIPAAAAAGFCQGVIWTAHATYIANIAASYTVLTNEKIQIVLSRFNGIFFVFYQCCQIIGGMISSIVLKSPEEPLLNYLGNGTMLNQTMFGNETFLYSPYTNVTFVRDYSHCGRNYCPFAKKVKEAAPVDRTLVYILVGIFTACCLTGILVLALLLDQLEGQMKKTQAAVGKQMVAVFKFYCNRHAICLVGLMFYSLLQAAFMFGEYNKAFVTCTIGIHMVGFVMMTLSASSAVAAFFNGRIQKWTSRPPLLAAAGIFQFGVFMTLLVWKPTPADRAIFFILVIFWGMGDGIIMTQDISLIGFLFSHNKEPAFAALKMTQSIANFLFFMVSSYLCTVQKIAFVLTVLIVAMTGYFSLELMMFCDRKRGKKEALEALREEEKKPITT